jgi:hypothetical protein
MIRVLRIEKNTWTIFKLSTSQQALNHLQQLQQRVYAQVHKAFDR